MRGAMSSVQLAGFSLPEIQSRASADGVLKGTIGRADGQRLRVTVNLLRTKDGTSILSRRFMPVPTELPDIGAAIAADVSRVLGGSSAVRPKPLIAAAAYDHYLRGRFLAEQRTPESLNLAVQSYRNAIAADPTYAQPWVGLADAYVALGVPTFGPLRPLESRRLAKEAVFKALDLDAQSAEAHCTLGFISYFQDWSWRQAENEFRRALVLNPEYALGHDWYGDYLNAMGRFPEAMQQITRAREIEPLSPLIHRDVAWQYFFQRRFDEAVMQLRETLTMDASFGPAHSLLARALIEKRDIRRGARRAVASALAASDVPGVRRVCPRRSRASSAGTQAPPRRHRGRPRQLSVAVLRGSRAYSPGTAGPGDGLVGAVVPPVGFHAGERLYRPEIRPVANESAIRKPHIPNGLSNDTLMC